MARSAAIQDRVAEAILDVAANLLAGGGEPPSMAEIAAAAGVGRATLYRHFPTREQLLQALSTTARDATATRLIEADLDAVPVTEAIARVARVVAAGGSQYAALDQPVRRLGLRRRRRTADRHDAPGAAATRPRRRHVPRRPRRRGTALPARPAATGRGPDDRRARSRRRESRRAHHLGVPARHRALPGHRRRRPGGFTNVAGSPYHSRRVRARTLLLSRRAPDPAA